MKQSISEARNEVLRAAQKQTETDTLLAEAHKCSSRLDSELRQRNEKLKRVEAELLTQQTTATTHQKENQKLVGENSQLKTNVQQLDAEVAKYKQENAQLQKKKTDEAQKRPHTAASFDTSYSKSCQRQYAGSPRSSC